MRGRYVPIEGGLAVPSSRTNLVATSILLLIVMGAVATGLWHWRDRIEGHGIFFTRGVVFWFIVLAGLSALLSAIAVVLRVAM